MPWCERRRVRKKVRERSPYRNTWEPLIRLSNTCMQAKLKKTSVDGTREEGGKERRRKEEEDDPRASITITMPVAALARSGREPQDNGRKYWTRDARHRTGKQGIIHNGVYLFKSRESVKARRAKRSPGEASAMARLHRGSDILSRLNFPRSTGYDRET